VPESYGGELHFLFEFFWVVDSSSVYECGLFHVFSEVFWFEFLNSSHSVTSSAKAKGEVVNVGNPQEVTILELAKKIKDQRGNQEQVFFCFSSVDKR